MKIDETCKRLDQLKGTLLMRPSGALYLLKGYEVVRSHEMKTKKFFRTRIEVIDYISSMTFSNDYTEKFEPGTSMATWHLNNMIDDRNRYLQLLKSLKYLGYTILKTNH